VSAGRLRVGVDGRAFSSPAGGVRRYVGELYAAIGRHEPEVEVIAIGARRDAQLPAGAQRRNAIPLPTNLGWMAGSIPLAARSAALDVYHAPAYTAPLWGVHPLVLTIHDVSYERRPEWNAYRNDPVRRLFYRTSARVADRIVTDSAFSRAEITAAYAIPASRIDVVPLAAADAFTPGAFDPARVPPDVRTPYALHVGDLHIRRNVTTALAAVLRVRQHETPAGRLSLVCAGIDRGTAHALTTQAREASDPQAVILLGPVPEATLINLYRGAALLVYPSRYEGFGLPILEAMQCGIPVVGSRSASVPELMADAGVLLDELDVDAWTRTILSVVADPRVRADLVTRSLERAARYSWAHTARATVAVFRSAALEARRRRTS
jgi:glycosyltransferase involved in cell wall biosynthesis